MVDFENFLSYWFIPFLFIISSGMAYLIGRRVLRLSKPSLRQVLDEVMESVGFTLFFLFLNSVLGIVFVLLVRLVVPGFLTFYVLEDVMLFIVSAFQAFLFQLWRRRGARSHLGDLR